MWNERQKGFGMMEAMVAMSLLGIAMYGGMNYIQNMQKSRNSRGTQSMYRFLAVQIIQTVVQGISYYPPISLPGTKDKVLYIGCFDRDGVLLPDQNGQKEFQFVVTSSYSDSVASGVCKELALYEARFFWADPKTKEVMINILSLKQGQERNSLAYKNVKIFAK